MLQLPPSEFMARLRTIYAWARPVIWPYRWQMVFSWLLVTTLSGVTATPILLARRIVQDFQGSAQHLPLNLAGLAAAILTIGGLRFVGTFLLAGMDLRLRHGLEEKYVRWLASAPLSYYESNSSSSIALAAFNQIPLLARLTEVGLRDFVQAGMTIIVALAVLFYTSPRLGFACLLALPLFVAGPHLLSRSVERAVRGAFQRISEKHSSMIEALISVKTIRTMGLSERKIQEVRRISEDAMRHERKTLAWMGASQLVMDGVFAAGAVLILLFVHRRMVSGEMTLALGAAALTGFLLLAREARMFANGLVELRRTVGACGQIIHFLEQAEPAACAENESAPANVNCISLVDLAFSYDGVREVLNGMNMVFRRNEITGIVGTSGGGKSTLADLMLRLRNPVKGRIMVDGSDLAGVSESWLRKTFTLVDQEPFLFNTTIRENLLLAAPDLGSRELEEALKAASAWEFVSALPKKLDTIVGAGGALLSVGEKQRIALARALIIRPLVLVLDEITSALDPENEAAILRALRGAAPGRIIILISHRERVADFCDRIYRIEAGRTWLLKPGHGA